MLNDCLFKMGINKREAVTIFTQSVSLDPIWYNYSFVKEVDRRNQSVTLLQIIKVSLNILLNRVKFFHLTLLRYSEELLT